jgi:hypothetical protein
MIGFGNIRARPLKKMLAKGSPSSRYNFLHSDYSLWRLEGSKIIGSGGTKKVPT